MDYIDILMNAKKEGILMDSCGSDERQYSWGMYTDLCGMSVEDAKNAASACCRGGSDDPILNTVNFTFRKNPDNDFNLIATPTFAPTEQVKITFTHETTDYLVTLQKNKATQTDTGYVFATNSPTFTNFVIETEDKVYKYEVKVISGTTDTQKVYYGYYRQKTRENITANDILGNQFQVKEIEKGSFNTGDIVIPEEGSSAGLTPEQRDALYEEKDMAFIIALKKEIYDDGKYDIVDPVAQTSIKSQFITVKNLNINNVNYQIIALLDTDYSYLPIDDSGIISDTIIKIN